MISYNYETELQLDNEQKLSEWIAKAITEEGFNEGEINYIFCDDAYLLKLNVQYLDHDTLTDIISFDYTLGKQINGDVYISAERVRENAKDYAVSFENEMSRVLIHGILHYCGYKDKSEADEAEMRSKENYYLAQLD
ncbi:rRNA maturation RNase YbeY [Gelidibacter algens]|jgi:rRNA maturation RNase YbeY|uniref:Endoribonuclease YbeY n=1 Tax=Gelidibacter algens TaxID=49280 RepID=A0A1A7QXH2_9FLAO|nr:rRNA maturation RNase YbeY [Gelidibacter algens]OBX23978.1 rRNA maturation RNase YbeY [Gelidibacter algens]RAJ24344.1 rRNA maturation RNase YbeY [Gelidibacter algens]